MACNVTNKSYDQNFAIVISWKFEQKCTVGNEWRQKRVIKYYKKNCCLFFNWQARNNLKWQFGRWAWKTKKLVFFLMFLNNCFRFFALIFKEKTKFQ